MKRLIIVLLMISSSFSLTSCTQKALDDTTSTSTNSIESTSSNTDESAKDDNLKEVNKAQESNSSEKGNSTKSPETNSDNEVKTPANTDADNTNTKQYYLQKLDNIEKGLSDLDSLRAGSNADMKQAAGEEYRRWDDALNEIFSVLRNQLPASEMKSLEKDELKWIKDKENKAAESASQFKGGSAESLIYTGSLASSTKDRCYYLVNTYLN